MKASVVAAVASALNDAAAACAVRSQRRKPAQIHQERTACPKPPLSIPEFHSIANAMEIRFLFEPS